MKKFTAIVLLLMSVVFLKAQNLVPNPSFENYTTCPSTLGEIYQCQSWSSFGRSPDYFNSCSTNSITGVPYNYYGFQQAATGNAYCGIVPYSAPFLLSEYIGAQLLQPLTVGQEYFVSFKISFPGEPYCPTFNTGVRFSTVAFDSLNYVPANNISQVYTSSVISDTINWFHVMGSFIADSAYTYISIGNFLTINCGQCPILTWNGYNYIDDVCVSTDSMTCYSSVGIQELNHGEEIILSPNPFIDKLNIKTVNNELSELILYDIASRKLLQQSFINSISFNTDWFSQGIYFYEVKNEKGIIRKGKVVKE